MSNNFFNQDCINGMKMHIDSDSIDLVITDPPYGIDGDKLHKHYNRKESNVIDGYVEIPKEEYQEFSIKWIKECERVLKPSGSMYIVSGYSCLREILNALNETDLVEINHLIWEYNFGVYTKNKYVSSHYHILFYVKSPEKKKTFNTFCRFENTKESYKDRIDVFQINREYKPGQIKNKNQLPTELVRKLLLYSSNEGDVILDPFLGGFTTAFVAIEESRVPVGFEINKSAFDYFADKIG
jgi:site-specific DNA-methyltransferase (adenine-specific)